MVAGDVLVGRDGQRVAVEGVRDAGRVAAVYNVEVEGDRTYFVGGDGWGFDLWSHNACSGTSGNNLASALGRRKHDEFTRLMQGKNSTLFRGETKLQNGKRVDGLKFNRDGPGGIIYELKPNNPRAVARGVKQVNGYVAQVQQQFGGIWRGVVIKY